MEVCATGPFRTQENASSHVITGISLPHPTFELAHTSTSVRVRLACAGLSLSLLASLPAAALRAADFTPPSAEQRLAALGPLDGEFSSVRRLLTPDDDFEPIEAPEPPDWLAMHEEPGQPYANFVLSDVQRASETRRVIYLQPLGEFPADSAPSVEALRDYAAAFFQLEVTLLPADMIESAAFEPRINTGTKKPQLRSTAILTWLGERLPADGFCIVAVTMTDLYPAPNWNFVYGQASSLHRAGVFSFARHDPLFFGRDRSEDFDAVMLRRSCKTLVHEIAHIFGLGHCIYFRCVENGVNHAAEGDSRPHHLCPVCLRKIRYATSADLETRYRDLAYFYSQHSGWEAEEAWVRRQLAKLRDPVPAPNRSITIPMPPAFPTVPTPGVVPLPAPSTPDIQPAPSPPARPDAAVPPVPTPAVESDGLMAAHR